MEVTETCGDLKIKKSQTFSYNCTFQKHFINAFGKTLFKMPGYVIKVGLNNPKLQLKPIILLHKIRQFTSALPHV